MTALRILCFGGELWYDVVRHHTAPEQSGVRIKYRDFEEVEIRYDVVRHHTAPERSGVRIKYRDFEAGFRTEDMCEKDHCSL